MNDREILLLERQGLDPAMKETLIARYFANIRLVALIVLILSGAGLAAYFTLPRELNPDIQIPIVFVTTPFPGAGPEDIEALVTTRLEDAFEGLSGVNKITSSSKENVSAITIEFSSGTDPQRAKNDVQDAVEKVSQLPEDSERPTVQVLDFQNQPVLTFLLGSRGDPATLESLADTVKEALRATPGVQSVEYLYRQEPFVEISLKPEVLQERGLTPLTLVRAIEAAVTNFPAGAIATDNTAFALTQDRLTWSVTELQALPLNVNGQALRLGEVVNVRETPSINTPEALYASHAVPAIRAITFSVFKSDGADTGQTVADVTTTVNRLTKPFGDTFIFEPIFNGAKEIQKSFDQLFRDFVVTVLLVFIVLFVFFGLRQSIVSALAIPLTFLGTFLVMQITGISINFIALFSLLLALGILVDNAIVIISAIASYERTKRFTPAEIALLTWRDFHTVIFTTTITTVWAFLPLLLASGIIGEFIKPIPIVVSSALAISALVALFIVTPLMVTLLAGVYARRFLIAAKTAVFLLALGALFFALPEGPFRFLLLGVGGLLLFLILVVFRRFWSALDAYEETHFARLAKFLHQLSGRGLFDFHVLSLRYERFIRGIIREKTARRKTLTLLILFCLFAYALVPTGYVVNEFFPSDDQETIFVSLDLPAGTSLQESETVLHDLVEQFRHFPESRFVLGEVGAIPPTDNSPSGTREYHHLLATLILTPAKERERTSSDIVAAIKREYGSNQRGQLSATQISGGPPAGSDLQLTLLGKDLTTLEALADKTKQWLETQPGVSNVTLSISSGTSKIVFVPDQAVLARENISSADLAFYLRTLGSGFTIESDARFGDAERDIILRLTEGDTLAAPDVLGRLTYPAPGRDLPFLALGDFRLATNPTLITREDGERSLAVSASVDEEFSVSTLNQALEKFAATDLALPEGYSWKTGGVNEENDKSVRSILQAMLLSALLIFGTMTLQFNSFRKALIVLLVIPLAVSGVFVIFALFGIPLSFPSLIGVLALFGIVVNNSIIMVDKINRNLETGLPVIDAISTGAASRLEPILLTALTTVVGLIPITLADPIWQGLGGAIIAGLTFSGVAKLFFIPVMYAMWFGETAKESAESPAQTI